MVVVGGACCVLDGRFDVLLSFCLRTSDGNGIGGMGRNDNDGIDALLFVANGKPRMTREQAKEQGRQRELSS